MLTKATKQIYQQTSATTCNCVTKIVSVISQPITSYDYYFGSKILSLEAISDLYCKINFDGACQHLLLRIVSVFCILVILCSYSIDMQTFWSIIERLQQIIKAKTH